VSLAQHSLRTVFGRFPRFQAAVIHQQPESANLQNQACFAFVVFLKGGAGFFV